VVSVKAEAEAKAEEEKRDEKFCMYSKTWRIR